MIARTLPIQFVFFVPTTLLLVFCAICYRKVYDTPELAGLPAIETGDANLNDIDASGKRLNALQVGKKMFSNPVIVTIALVEFCSGFLRNAIMNWYIIFAKQTGLMAVFVSQHWGLLLCCAGILGGVFAGPLSDKVFQSRRGPVSAVLYGIMLIGGIAATFMLRSEYLGWLVVFMSMAIIGVHGMLSGAASMDFGGRKNVGTAVGIIDGMVYLGTAAEALYYGKVLPNGDAAKNPDNWGAWPMAMIPIALIGLFLTIRLWNAKPNSQAVARHEVKIPVTLASEEA
jgi:OPA family glycerol-3-phosphate transporter-like MFS transporter